MSAAPGGSGSGWPKRRAGWLGGAVVVLGLGALIGAILGSVWVGVLLGLLVSIGWLIAYESWRGKTPHLHDDDDDGARL
ncbi:MAG TPA: hypothetical protein VJR25_00315 [Microbacterium sp.]|uniref:hypothetical protein n=1 Tax=Microbacterium sp. TaxID=51671 RepID=UPI002B468E09|nr:hypothetical protein [Microbacterium sp.]HKT55187.1 hypothetical protein [Microbacterium sp.]